MSSIKLSKIDTRAPADLDKKEIKEKTKALIKDFTDFQNLLYAENKHSILIVLQGMDGSGKDGVIRNVLTGMNPQGVFVKPFKAPTEEELSRDFLWRVHKHTPEKGAITVFNRSHYEDIIITRVHKWCDDALAKKRMQAINDFERMLLEHNNTHILKFYLHISRDEQEERLTERIHNPAKMWKYNAKDMKEAELWDVYQQMYEECFEECNKPPWTIVPADQNWYKEYIVASKLHKLLSDLDMRYPGLKEE